MSYAHDVVIIGTDRDPDRLLAWLGVIANDVNAALCRLGSILCGNKSINVIVSPGNVVGTASRRNPYETPYGVRRREAALTALDAHVGLEERLPSVVSPPDLAGRLLYKYETTVRVLGVIMDNDLNFDQQREDMFKRALVRRGLLACPYRSAEGLNA